MDNEVFKDNQPICSDGGAGGRDLKRCRLALYPSALGSRFIFVCVCGAGWGAGLRGWLAGATLRWVLWPHERGAVVRSA